MLFSGRFNEKVSHSDTGTLEDIKHKCLDVVGLSSSVDNIICIEPPYKLRREGTDLVLTTLSSVQFYEPSLITSDIIYIVPNIELPITVLESGSFTAEFESLSILHKFLVLLSYSEERYLTFMRGDTEYELPTHLCHMFCSYLNSLVRGVSFCSNYQIKKDGVDLIKIYFNEEAIKSIKRIVHNGYVYLTDGFVVIRLIAEFADADVDLSIKELIKYKLKGIQCRYDEDYAIVIGSGVHNQLIVDKQFIKLSYTEVNHLYLNSHRLMGNNYHIRNLYVNIPPEELLSLYRYSSNAFIEGILISEKYVTDYLHFFLECSYEDFSKLNCILFRGMYDTSSRVDSLVCDIIKSIKFESVNKSHSELVSGYLLEMCRKECDDIYRIQSYLYDILKDVAFYHPELCTQELLDLLELFNTDQSKVSVLYLDDIVEPSELKDKCLMEFTKQFSYSSCSTCVDWNCLAIALEDVLGNESLGTVLSEARSIFQSKGWEELDSNFAYRADRLNKYYSDRVTAYSKIFGSIALAIEDLLNSPSVKWYKYDSDTHMLYVHLVGSDLANIIDYSVTALVELKKYIS